MSSYKSSPTAMKPATKREKSFEESYRYLKKLLRDLKINSGMQLLRVMDLDEQITRDLREQEAEKLLDYLNRHVLFSEKLLVPPIPQELEKAIRLQDQSEWLPWENEAIERVEKWQQELASEHLAARRMLKRALNHIRSEYRQEVEERPDTQHGSVFSTENINGPLQEREGLPSGDNEDPGEELDENPVKWTQEGYDVAISFAAEDAELAHQIAGCLQDQDLKVFHGSTDSDDLWGIDLAEHLDGVYWSARLCVIILSQHYRLCEWSDFETELLTRRAKIDTAYALMVVSVDDEPMPDALASYATIDLRSLSVEALCAQVKARVSALPELDLCESPCKEPRVVHVISRERGWAVTPQEARRALRVFDTREQAVKFSEGLRDRDPCVEVVVHNSDGTVYERVPSQL